ncbi:hypothetical protein [Microbulbifer sp. S227A]|uniref:hypothetical protein n=1 Tax=Microbulbifer sp. S227A TaxID=3415131 RepID=UPI003C7C5305
MFNTKWISGPALTVGICLALTPAVFGVGPWLESRLFPVVRDTRISQPHESSDGISFFVAFRKVRQCEFMALVWYENATRLVVDFEPDADQSPRTRPTGEQYTGPWLVRGLQSLERSQAYVYHRCHPLWITISTFHDG